MQIILHYSCILPVLVDLNISEATLIQVITYASPGSVMNKVFPTSRVCAWWAFKVAVHRTCVLLLLHEWLEHASQSLSGGVGWLGGWGGEAGQAGAAESDSALTFMRSGPSGLYLSPPLSRSPPRSLPLLFLCGAALMNSGCSHTVQNNLHLSESISFCKCLENLISASRGRK